jgi:hypothetical protein
MIGWNFVVRASCPDSYLLFRVVATKTRSRLNVPAPVQRFAVRRRSTHVRGAVPGAFTSVLRTRCSQKVLELMNEKP